jgi:hypothetical protein
MKKTYPMNLKDRITVLQQASLVLRYPEFMISFGVAYFRDAPFCIGTTAISRGIVTYKYNMNS